MQKFTATIVYETDLSCGGAGGRIDSLFYPQIIEAIVTAVAETFSTKKETSRMLSIREALTSVITEEAQYQAAYTALGIYDYQIISKKEMLFSEAIGAYRALQAITVNYMEEAPGFGNCDGFEEIVYKGRKEHSINGESKGGTLYHHYIKGDGGSIFFTLT